MSKYRPSSANPVKLRAKRPSTAQKVSTPLRDDSFLNTSTNLFLTSTQPTSRPKNILGSQHTSFFLDMMTKTLQTPSKPIQQCFNHGQKDSNPNTSFNESKSIFTKSSVEPPLKFDSTGMHCYLYKYKQKRDALEKKIRQMVAFEVELNADKLQFTSKQKLDQSLMIKSFRFQRTASAPNDDQSPTRTSNLLNSPIKASTRFHTDHSSREEASSPAAMNKSVIENNLRPSQRPMSAQIPDNKVRSTSASVRPKRIQCRPQTTETIANSQHSKEASAAHNMTAPGYEEVYESPLKSFLRQHTDASIDSQRDGEYSRTRHSPNRSRKQNIGVFTALIKATTEPLDAVQGRSLQVRRPAPPPVIHSRELYCNQRLQTPKRNTNPDAYHSNRETRPRISRSRDPNLGAELEVMGRTIDAIPDVLMERSLQSSNVVLNSKHEGHSFEQDRERLTMGEELISLENYWKKVKNNESFDVEKWSKDGKDAMKMNKMINSNNGMFNRLYKRKRVPVANKKKMLNMSAIVSRNSTMRTTLNGWTVVNTNDVVEKTLQ